MAYRCDGCDGKFGSTGEATADVQSEDVNDSSVSVEVELNIECGNCGNSPFRQGYLTLEGEIDVDAHDEDCEITDPDTGEVVTLESDLDRFHELADSERTFEITDSPEVEVNDDYFPKYKETRNKKTGEIKRKPVPMRFQRHIYQLEATVGVRCSACGSDLEVKVEGEIGASELEAA